MNYLFYDLETTGLCESFDQVVRFASITTNENFEELDRNEISIQLRPDVVPSPYALIVTRLGINDITNGVSEYDALTQIHHLFNTPNQINIGYNSLSFDNNMLRFGFYRNLLDPYSHQYKNNAFRADAMNINLIYYLYKNEVISWNEDRPMKLENINQINNFIDGKSHDAMVDVEVTVALCKALKLHDSRTWDYLMNGFIKNTDISRLKKLSTINIGERIYPIGIYTDITLGYDSNCCCVAVCLGRHDEYKNQSLWMKIDYPHISEYLDIEDKAPRILKRKDGEPRFILPWDKSYDRVITKDKRNNVLKNIEWLNKHADTLESFIVDIKGRTYEKIDKLDIDASIYDQGLFKTNELHDISQFHDASIEGKIQIINSLSSGRVHDLGLRILFRNYYDQLPESMKNKIKSSIASINSVNTKEKPRRSPVDAINEANTILLEEDLDDEQTQILNQYVSYLNGLKN